MYFGIPCRAAHRDDRSALERVLKRPHRRADRFFRLLVMLVAVFSLLAGCNLPVSSSGVLVWIDVPLDGLAFPDLQTVEIVGHASSLGDISRIEIRINDMLLTELDDPPMESSLASFQAEFTPSASGEYTILVIAYDSEGTAGSPDIVHITFGGLPTGSGSTTPANSPTQTVTITPTKTVVPAATTVTATTAATVTITLTAVPTFTRTATSTLPPSDTTPPPAPELVVPANGLSIACKASQTLAWLPASDPSGIGGYQVQVERHAGDNNWQTAPGGSLSVGEKTAAVPVECGWYYRWRVRATDGAGNVGSWSAWSLFAITLT